MKLTTKLLLLIWFATTTAHAQIASFQHVIVIVQENRTPDNLFQGLCTPPYGATTLCSTTPTGSQYNIQTNHWLDKHSTGGTINPTAVPLANQYDLSHAHSAFVKMCDANSATGACAMDGAGDISCSGICPPKPQFKFVSNSTAILNPYLNLATQYGWANYMFQTNQGPSFPAHQFLFGGTSAPSAADDAAGIFASENMSGTSRIAGCAAPTGTTVELINPSSGENQKVYPCFEHQTIADVLPPGFTWRYYTPSAGSIWTAPTRFSISASPLGRVEHAPGSSGPIMWTSRRRMC
jgi:phospholipase C